MDEWMDFVDADEQMPPHFFRIADDAFRGVRDKGKGQAIVVSGESLHANTTLAAIVHNPNNPQLCSR
jgi:hypothetical protein